MSGFLMLIGALSLAAGVLGTVVVLVQEARAPLWLPILVAAGGVSLSLLWFALSGIVRRLDELRDAARRT